MVTYMYWIDKMIFVVFPFTTLLKFWSALFLKYVLSNLHGLLCNQWIMEALGVLCGLTYNRRYVYIPMQISCVFCMYYIFNLDTYFWHNTPQIIQPLVIYIAIRKDVLYLRRCLYGINCTLMASLDTINVNIHTGTLLIQINYDNIVICMHNSINIQQKF